MIRVFLLTTSLALAAGAAIGAQRSPVPPRTPGTRLITKAECAANLGAGVKSRRTFCDVISGAAPGDSVMMAIPPHTGAATLLFDLHNRFIIPVITNQPAVTYTRHEAVVGVIDGAGATIGRAAVVREFRFLTDLFDRIGGGGRPGGVKAVAPGPAEPVRFTIPSGVDTIGVVGASLRVTTALGADELFDTPGRPVAIVSNLRLEYRPR